MFRSVLSLLAGYLTILVFMIAGQVTLYFTGHTPDDPSQMTGAHLLWNQVTTVFAAFMGGLMTATVSHRKPLAHASGLAGIVFLLGLGNTTRLWHLMPHSYLISILLLNAPMIFLGGWIKSQVQKARALPVD
ncbi:MAG: hypothetical protein HYX26_10290 [Acidobacteriales bacterium]|nr:hypothetical protein [Terriglobales bacterium]